jgi:SAM-dependent methyltransferase
MSKGKVDSREIGLVAGLRLMNHLFHTDYLHYGYWNEGVKVDVLNLKHAQKTYSEFLYGFIPPGIVTILDVGCGSGRVAYELIQRGYRVDCISPSQRLTEFAWGLLGDSARIYRGRFEDVEIKDRYDLVLFSESFQYIKMNASLPLAATYLNPGGHIIVSDFFRNDGLEGSPIGGGHSLLEFRKLLKTYSLSVIREENITDRVAPTMDLVNGVSMEVVRPLYEDLKALLRDRFPLLAKLILWKYRRKLHKLENKHFTGARSAESFRKYKTYLTLLLQPEVTSPSPGRGA